MDSIKGQIVDILRRTIYPGELIMEGGKITAINPTIDVPDHYILPGFVDAHIHIESSMLVPYEFARIALRHGTVATVSDPHEIANVSGVEGVKYMIESARSAGLKFHFGAPSCVPATSFESAGAVLNSDDVKELLQSDDIYYLSEMMNYPGVLNEDPEVMSKLAYALDLHKPIDGHAPGLRGEKAMKYVRAGITTDHECYTLAEAEEKLSLGMKIIIREGSAAKNYNALHPIIGTHPHLAMFCSDDKHPDDLLEGHINLLVKRAIAQGYDLFDVLRMACINPKMHYKLRSGILRKDDPADFLIVDNLKDFNVMGTYIDGVNMVTEGRFILPRQKIRIINNFSATPKLPSDFALMEMKDSWPVIQAIDGELITEKMWINQEVPLQGDQLVNPNNDILKIAVVNRYSDAPPAVGLISGFGLRRGAIASTVAHDSHNIIAVGVNDKEIARAVNLLIQSKGGLSAVADAEERHLSLPVAGLMSDLSCEEIGKAYGEIDTFVKSMGSRLSAPFMALSFMALLVIPKIKMSDRGIFDAEAFAFY